MKSKYGSDIKIWIKKFFSLWAINQWKRERIAPSFHLDAFNIDPRTWCRFPILSSGFKEELDALDEVQIKEQDHVHSVPKDDKPRTYVQPKKDL